MLAAPFTPGNLVIYRVGTGTGSLVNTGSPVFLDEFTPTGTLVQSIALPTTVSGANKPLIASGTASSEGLLTRSADGQYLLATGYGTTLGGATSLSGTTGTTVNRVVARVDANASIDTTTGLSDFASGNNPRAVASDNGTNLWVGGGAGGIRYTTLSAATSTQISTTPTNIRQINIANGQLYISSGSSPFIGVSTVGTGLPTASGQTTSILLGFPNTGTSPYGFFFADLDTGVAGVDTLYVADDDINALRKYSLVSGTWTSNGTVGASSDDYRGLTGTVNGTTVTLYATRKGGSGSTGGGELVKLIDSTGYNGTFSPAPTLLSTASANTAYRGVALAPTALVTALAITSQPSSTIITTGQTTTLSVVATGTAPLSYQWYQGNSGDTTTPVGTNAASFTTPVLTTTTSYWVQVSDSSGSVNSSTATVMVNALTVAPSITSQPSNQSITSGQTATFTVVATGTAPLSYQWYQGNSGDTTIPVGTNAASFTTPVLTTTSNYWVQVSNSAGTADSNTVTATVTAVSITYIHDIQGSGSAFNPAFGGTQTIEGIVVRSFSGSTKLNGFYVQEEDVDADTNVATSEAIFVYDPTGLFTGSQGDKVRVNGAISEFVTTTSGTTSSLTQITVSSLSNLGTSTLPAVTPVQLPVVSVSDLERYEGMLVSVGATTGNLTVTEYFQLGRFGQILLSVTGTSDQPGTDARLDQFTQFNAPSVSGYTAYLNELDKRQIYLDDGSSTQNPDPILFGRGGLPLSAANTLRGGDTVASITGILDQRFEGYRIQTTTGVDFQATNTRPATPPVVGGTLKVLSFNVLNYFNGDGTGGTPGFNTSEQRGADNLTEFNRQRDKTIEAIINSGADILGLIELENDGFGPTSAIQDLINGLNAVAGTGTYALIDPGTSMGTDAIKVAFIYKPSKASPIGAAAVIPNAFGTGAFDVVGRKPLAQTFQEIATGQQFTAVINHFKSKGSSSGGAGDSDALDGQGVSNGTRTRQAQDLVAWLASNPTGTSDPDYLILGDLNAYAKEDPLTTLAAAGYVSLVPDSSYSYVFDGQLGSLDHALANSTLANQVTGAGKWHISADEPSVLDYNTEFKSAGQITSLYSPDQYRASDHDPVVVGLQLALPDLTVGLTAAPNPVVTGNPLTFTLTVGNLGNANATGVTTQFTLPSGVVVNSTTVSNGFSASTAGNVVTFSGGSINAGTNVTLTVTVTPSAAGILTSGTAVVDPANTIAETSEANNTAAAVSTTVIALPSISSFTPTTGPVGTVVTLNGANLSSTTAVTFNGVITTFSVVSDSQLTTTVPVGATSGTIAVTTSTGTATSTTSFIVIPAPTLTTVSPTSGPAGTRVTLTGTDLSNATSVTINGVSIPFRVNSATQITAIPSVATTSGAVAITTPGGVVSGASFTILPSPSFVNFLTFAGNTVDLEPGTTANANRLGGFFSDLFYDRINNVYYGLVDRGPGGGTIAYDTRVQKFTLDVNATTGAISNFNLIDTIILGNGTFAYNGLNPGLLNGDKSVLGLSQDPEGIVVAPNGNLFISDEYGPSVYEFDANGVLVRAFTVPANLVPKESTGTINYVDGRPTITTGRQDNRGFEGLTISPDGTKLYALLQDPLVNEGASNDGRQSRNLRMIRYDVGTGVSDAQYVYVLDDVPGINNALPVGASTFSTTTSQGRNIGISSITALSPTEFLVIERDNRGVGVDAPAYPNGTTNFVGQKRVFKVDLTGATDVTTVSLAGTNTLPGGTVPVTKTLFLDIKTALDGVGQLAPEKFEGLTLGPRLSDGSYALLIGTDNDFSVTQNGSNVQFDVCTDGTTSTQVPLDTACPSGQSLIPSFVYSFKTNQVTLAPIVAGFSPATGVAGTTVTLSGANFLGATAVSFNGVPASFVVNSDTSITATVPAGATSGLLSITTSGGTTSSTTSFTVIPGPTIGSFSPASGIVNTLVVLNGANFTGTTAVTFNGVAASFVVNSPTQITTSVPITATSGPIVVSGPNGSASTTTFSVLPFIQKFSPLRGRVGTTVNITGTGFFNVTSVTFNGVPVTSVTILSINKIRVKVPAGATTGPVTVVTSEGSFSKGTFTVTP